MQGFSEGPDMANVANAVRQALEPYVGSMTADTCVRATAISLGKTADDLVDSDLDALDARIRGLLEPIAPTATVDEVLSRVRRSVSEGV